MNSLPVKILAAIITFILGVAIANVWGNLSRPIPSVCPFPAESPVTRTETVFIVDTAGEERL